MFVRAVVDHREWLTRFVVFELTDTLNFPAFFFLSPCALQARLCAEMLWGMISRDWAGVVLDFLR